MPLKEVVPKNYSLLFDLNLDKLSFSGKEEIRLDVTENTSSLILNSKDLDIKTIDLIINGKKIRSSFELDNEKEKLSINIAKPVIGQVLLNIEFSGKLRDDLVGLYKSTYKTKDGSEHIMATTQFEAAHARKAFPCFDEPALKATFELSVRIDKDLDVISNMPVKDVLAEGSRKLVSFHITPRMSTYLLYLGAGKFEFLESEEDGTVVRIVTTKGKSQQGKYALELTKKFLSYFVEYSGVPYPLPKLDMIAIPDFAAGAMENWGAITFREIYLLFDSKSTSEAMKKHIAMIIAHEMWHQWSGDLVTMAWWNDLWLNESFATYMAYKAVDHHFPEWNMWEKFISSETEAAFGDDALKTTHPIEVEITNPKEIEEVFDSISYSKGGSVLRMLDDYLGHEKFRKGVNSYLLRHKYENAKSEDLWNCLANFSDKPVREIMSKWVKLKGYPLLAVELEGKSLSIKQRRFMFGVGDDDTVWPVPLVIKSSGKKPVTGFLDGKKKKIQLNSAPLWLKVNYNQSGFYRTKYSHMDLSKLVKPISEKELPAIDRWGIQSDLFRLSLHGEETLSDYLDFLSTYEKEDDYLVLSSIDTSLYHVYFIFSEERFWPEIWPRLKMRFRGPFKSALKRLGWVPKKNESQNDTLLRERAIRNLVFMEDEEVLKIAKERYNLYLKDRSSLHPNIRGAVLFAAAYTGDEKVYRKMLELYREAKGIEEKNVILQALGQFRDAKIAKQALDFFVTDEVKLQELSMAVGSATSNPYSRSALLTWLKRNWRKLKSYESGVSIFTHVLESLISAHVGEEAEVKLKQFFKSHPTPYRMAMERAFERIRRNTTWLKKNRDSLKHYFD